MAEDVNYFLYELGVEEPILISKSLEAVRDKIKELVKIRSSYFHDLAIVVNKAYYAFDFFTFEEVFCEDSAEHTD